MFSGDKSEGTNLLPLQLFAHMWGTGRVLKLTLVFSHTISCASLQLHTGKGGLKPHFSKGEKHTSLWWTTWAGHGVLLLDDQRSNSHCSSLVVVKSLLFLSAITVLHPFYPKPILQKEQHSTLHISVEKHISLGDRWPRPAIWPHRLRQFYFPSPLTW